MRWSFITFTLLLMLGIVTSTLAVRFYLTDFKQATSLQNISPVVLTDSDKLLIEERNSTAKWLLGLAIGLLPGVLLKKNKEGVVSLEDKFIPLLVGGLQILSIYGFFLTQQSLTFILSHGPKYLLYGMYSMLPVYFQFWTFLFSLILLLFYWAFPRKNNAPICIILFTTVLLITPQNNAYAAASSLKECVATWAKDRQQTMSKEDIEKASDVLSTLLHRINENKTDSCEFTNVSLDQIRYSASQSSAPDINLAIETTKKALTVTAISPASLLEKLISPWESPSGLLRINGQQTGATVLVDNITVGLTNLDLRLSPGPHSVIVSYLGNIIFQDDNVMIKQGESWSAKF